VASPFTQVANATATFSLPAAGTITDSLGNVTPATTTYTASLFLRSDPASQPADLPGVDPTATTLTGYAVNPQALNTAIQRGTRGTMAWQGKTWTVEVQGRNERYGDSGLIADLLTTFRGDDIRLTLIRQA
jgi:hypothetical protein